MEKASFSIQKYYFDKVNIDFENYKKDELLVDFKPRGWCGFIWWIRFHLSVFVSPTFNATRLINPNHYLHRFFYKEKME